MGKNQWVTTRGDKWAHMGEGNTRATGIYDTQKEAIAAGKAAARKQESELIIQGRDSKIRDKSSYGNDPYPPEG